MALLEGPDQILAIVDVLLATEKHVSPHSSHHDWYSILQIPRPSDDLDLIKRQYRHLALLLHPDKNKYPFCDQAFRFVAAAWNILSDPSKKSLYDKEFANSPFTSGATATRTVGTPGRMKRGRPRKRKKSTAYELTRPFTMPLMRLVCTVLERVPVTRPKIIDNLMKKFNQDLVFCRAPEDHTWTNEVLDRQVEKIDPVLDWVKSEFGVKPVVYTSIFGGKLDDRMIKAVEDLLKKTDDCELAAIDAMAAAGHSLIIAIAIFRGKLHIEEALELIRLEEDLQVERWGLVEGGHDVDIADLSVEISSAAVLLGLSRRV